VNGGAPPARFQSLVSYSDTLNAVIVFGGIEESGGQSLNDVWKFDLASLTWTDISAATGPKPVARFSLNGGVNGNSLVIFGGEDDDKNLYNDVWVFDLVSSTWSELVPLTSVIPEPRYGAAGGLVVLSGEAFLLVSHGFDRKNRYDNSFAISITGRTWIDITPTIGTIPTPRCLVAGAVYDGGRGIVYLGMFGGCGSGGYGPCPSNQMWSLTIDNLGIPGATIQSAWDQAPDCLRARNYGAMAGDPSYGGGTFFVYGGSGGPLVSQDAGGQLNSINRTSNKWNQYVAGVDNNQVFGQPSGNKQSAAVAVQSLSGGTLFLLLGGTNELYQFNYGSATAGLPSSEGCHSDPIPSWRTAHGVLMGVSWGFLLPIGVFIARFGRIKNPLWFKIHRAVQVTGLLLAIAGFVIAFLMVATGHLLAVPHSFIGLIVMALGIQQPINAFFRPHVEKGHEKKKSRIYWEYWHKYSGRVALVLGLINPFWGIIYLAGASKSSETVKSAGFVVYAVWVGIYVFAFIFLTAKGLPYTANGPSPLAQWVHKNLCCCLSAWDDSFQARKVGTAQPGDVEMSTATEGNSLHQS